MKVNFRIKIFYRKSKVDIVGSKLWFQHNGD